MRRHAETARRRLSFLFALVLPAAVLASSDRGPELQTVDVHPGDTLWSLSQRYLQDPQRWDEVLKYNPQIRADPTVALPGMSLKVPVGLLKPAFRAAVLTYVEGKVLRRPAAGGEWSELRAGASLQPGDTLRTEDWSLARIKFPHGSVLNLDSHSIVVVKAGDQGGDLNLIQGTLRALDLRLQAGASAIQPHEPNTIYEVSARMEGPVRVQVFGGAAAVSAGSGSATLVAGFEVDVPPGGAPEAPRPIAGPETAAIRRASPSPAPAPANDLGAVQVDLETLQTGVPLSGFRLQLARSSDFSDVVLDKMFEPDERVSLKQAQVVAGVYWWRAAPVDLLGQTGAFSPPKRAVVK